MLLQVKREGCMMVLQGGCGEAYLDCSSTAQCRRWGLTGNRWHLQTMQTEDGLDDAFGGVAAAAWKATLAEAVAVAQTATSQSETVTCRVATTRTWLIQPLRLAINCEHRCEASLHQPQQKVAPAVGTALQGVHKEFA